MAIQRSMLDCIAALAMTIMLLFASPAAAQNFPKLTGRVVDQANLLRPEQKLDLDSKLANLEAQSGRQFVVATVNSLEGREISDYAYRLGRAWQIGDKERDDGVVMVVAPNERKVWIATGYGADDVLTDVMTGLIIRQAVLPRFKAGDMGGGIIAGADAVIRQLQLPPEEAAKQAQKAEQTRRADQAPDFGAIIVPIIFILFFLISIFGGRRGGGRRYRRRRGGGIDPVVVLWGLDALSRASRGSASNWGSGGSSWGGGGGGFGGGFSGGGGSFGGGGAGGSW